MPIVGQFYRGAWATKMLSEADKDTRVFLHAEPSNAYDKNAYKVLIWKFDKLNHVGYVQRHAAAKIAGVMQGSQGYDNRKTFIVCRLKNDIGGNDTFEAEIIGAITDVQALIKRDAALKTNGGIFDTPKKRLSSRKECESQLWNKWSANNTSLDPDIDDDLYGGLEECDLY